MSHAIIAPIGLGGLFGEDSDTDNQDSNTSEGGFQQQFEIQVLNIAGRDYSIRQFSWHQANANQVWPGTFRLANYIIANKDKFNDGTMLELGAATGALALCLITQGFNVFTSDYDDDGSIASNIIFNFDLNGTAAPRHVPFTWGDNWEEAVVRCEQPDLLNLTDFKYIVASDILLYVSAYPALVASLKYLFQRYPSIEEFVMSWNRRIAESAIFFELMTAAGFTCVHLGNCIYSFKITIAATGEAAAVEGEVIDVQGEASPIV